MIARAMLIGFLIFPAACGHGAAGPAAEAEKPVTLTGYAADARAGAVITTDEGDTIYVIGLATWPADLLGRRVEVTGLLTRKKLIPDPEVNENGEHTAGAYGLQDVMEKPKWKAAQ